MFGMNRPLFKILYEVRLKEHAMMFMKPNASQDEIVKSGEEVIASLYGSIIFYEGLDFVVSYNYIFKCHSSVYSYIL
jgi:hypothetical protein